MAHANSALRAALSQESAFTRTWHPYSAATVQQHDLAVFHSVGVLDIVSTMSVRPSVAKASHFALLIRLATSTGTRFGLPGPGRRHILCHRPSIFSLKIVPGGTLSSANKWATCLTRFSALRSLKDWHGARDPADGGCQG